MRKVKGFVFVAVLILLAATILAQPILLEITTNFTAHKLEPGKSLVSENLNVMPQKSFTLPSIFTIKVPLKKEKMGAFVELEKPLVFPQKYFGVDVKRKSNELNLLTYSHSRSDFFEGISTNPPLLMAFPQIYVKKSAVSFASFKRRANFQVEDLNIQKNLNVIIASLTSSKRRMKSSLKILEMKKKISAYSPLGGLETIGKYLERNDYAFWVTQNRLGMAMDTPLLSNWVAYNYKDDQISNLSLSFNAGPFSTLLSMKNGNVKASVQTRYGWMFGGTITSNATISIFSYIPISIGNFESVLSGEYILNSSPTVFHPGITLRYKMGDFVPYASYSWKNSNSILHLGILKNALDFDSAIVLKDRSAYNVSLKYLSQFGVFSTGVGKDDKIYSTILGYSSRPFGFNALQFSFDGNLQFNSLKKYEVDAKLSATFKFLFSYVDSWITGKFNGDKSSFSYGMEVEF